MDIGGGLGEANYPEAGTMQAISKSRESYSQRLVSQIDRQTVQLADLKRMQEILTKHPEFEELLTLVGRNRF